MEKNYMKYLIKETIKEIEEERIEKELMLNKEQIRKKQTLIFEDYDEMKDYFISLIRIELDEKEYILLERGTFQNLVNKHTEYRFINLRCYEERNRTYYSVDTIYLNLFDFLPEEMTLLSRGVSNKTIIYLKNKEEIILKNLNYGKMNINILEKKYKETFNKIEYWNNRQQLLKRQLDLISNN